MPEYSDEYLFMLASKAAESQEKEKVLNEVLVYYKRALKYLNEKNIGNLQFMSIFQDFKKAIALCIVNDVDKKFIAEIYFNRGVACEKDKDNIGAIANFKIASTLDPSNSQYIEVVTSKTRQYSYLTDFELLLKKRLDRYDNEKEQFLKDAEKEAKERAEKEAKEKADREAFEKIKQEADQGNTDAQYELGLLYKSGKGVMQDTVKGNEIINKLAEQGNEKAKDYLQKQEEIRKENERRRIAEKKRKTFGVILQLLLCVAYCYILFGTDIIRARVNTDEINFLILVPFIIFTLAVGMVSLIFLSTEEFHEIFLLIGMIFVQSITFSVWVKGGFLGFIMFLMINIIGAIPGAILWGVNISRDNIYDRGAFFLRLLLIIAEVIGIGFCAYVSCSSSMKDIWLLFLSPFTILFLVTRGDAWGAFKKVIRIIAFVLHVIISFALFGGHGFWLTTLIFIALGFVTYKWFPLGWLLDPDNNDY